MRFVSRWLALVALVPVLALAAESAPKFDEGIEYQRIVPAQPTDVAPGKVEVIEMFWYGCPHCYHLEPSLNKWIKQLPSNVVFERMPAVLSERWAPAAKAYYAAQVLGVLDRVHEPLFEAIHEKKRPLDTEDALVKFFGEYGVSEADARKAMDSFLVDTRVRRARLMTQRYGIDGVPAMVVDGKYRTNVTLAGDRESMFKVLDFLIEKETASAKTPVEQQPAG